MPASLQQIRRTMDVQPTARDKGLTLTLRITAYDSGLVSVDGTPVNDQVAAHGTGYDPAAGMLYAAVDVATILAEFHQQAQRRRGELS